MSDRHAYLQLVEGRLVCLDLGSRNSMSPGGRCRRLIDVDRESPIRVGPFRIRLLGGDDPAGTQGRDHGRTRYALELSHRALRKTHCDLPPGLSLVGSGIDCPIRLIDPSVSAYHCSIVHTAAGVWVVDLLGQGGVRVNGNEVSFARLMEGDHVDVGHSVLRLVSTAGEPAAAVTPTAPPTGRPRPARGVGPGDDRGGGHAGDRAGLAGRGDRRTGAGTGARTGRADAAADARRVQPVAHFRCTSRSRTSTANTRRSSTSSSGSA